MSLKINIINFSTWNFSKFMQFVLALMFQDSFLQIL
jgi:hypothetical protein